MYNYEEPRKIISENEIEAGLLEEDYGQHAPALVQLYINLALNNGAEKPEDFFYQKVKPENILTFEEYLEQYCSQNGLTAPEAFSAELKKRIRATNSLARKLKEAVAGRADLKTLYELTLRFREAGLPVARIEELANKN